MLDNCNSLYECEKILLASLDNIKYLGEVNFSIEDIRKLSGLIKEKISEDEKKGLRFLRDVPACLSFYLVGKGIINYYSGEFWPPVLEELGITDDRSQNMLGEIFLNFLQGWGFSHVRIKGALPYVAPILLHGGIPLSCIKEFYEKVIKYLLELRMVDENNIRDEICRVREIEKHRETLLEKKDEILEKVNTLQQEIEHLENIIELFRKREELQKITANQEAWVNLPNYYFFIATSESRQLAISRRIEELLNKKAGYQKRIKTFTPYDQMFLDFKGKIEKLVQEFDPYQDMREKILALVNETKGHEDELNSLAAHFWQKGEQSVKEFPWMQRINRRLRGFFVFELARLSTDSSSDILLDADKFAALVKELPSFDLLIASGEAWVSRFKVLQAACREHQRCEQELALLKQEMTEWEIALEQVAVTLSDPVTGPPEQIIKELNERVIQAKIRKKEADATKETLEKKILPAMHDAETRKAQVEKEIVRLEQRLRELGEGDLEAGIRALKEKNQALVELKEIEGKIDQFFMLQIPGSLDEALDLEQKLAQEIDDLRKYVELKKEQEKLMEVAVGSEAWVDLPDYYQFIADKKPEINEIEQEIKKLKERETECLKQIESYTKTDQQLLEWAEAIKKMAQGLTFYQEQHRRQGLLKAKIDKQTKEIECLVSKLRLERWNEKYSNVVCGLDIAGISHKLEKFFQENSLCDKIKEKLDIIEIKVARPGLAVWVGGTLMPVGMILILTTQNNAGCLALLAGFVLVSVGYGRFKKDKAYQTKQNESRKKIERELQQAENNLGSSMKGLAKVLEVLPVSLEFLVASGEAWLSRFKVLQEVCRERQRDEQKLARIEQEMAEWETNLRQVAATLFDPVTGPPEQVIKELNERVIQAKIRKKEADATKETFEKKILPAMRDAETRKAQVEKEIVRLEQRLRELGEGDLEAGIRALKEKNQALVELKEIEGKLKRFVKLKISESLDEALDREQKLTWKINELKKYINLKKEQKKLMEIVAGSEAWADLPDYYRFVADKELELREMEQEIKGLNQEETECMKQIVLLYTKTDQQLLEWAEKIMRIEQDLTLYQERHRRQGLLKAKTDKQMEEIKCLVSELWPEEGKRIYSTSAGVELPDFIKYASSEETDHLLNTWMKNLKKLQMVHNEYEQCIDKRLSLEKEAKYWEESVKLVATDLSYPTGETPEKIVAGLFNHLKQAEEKKEDAEAARTTLEKEVFPALHDARSLMSQVEQEVAVVEQKVRELGKDDLETGARILEEKKQALKELKEIEKKLEQHAATLTQAVDNRQEALSIKEEKHKELNIMRDRLFRVEEQLTKNVSPFEYADEPVRRFVTYGGEWAIRWLCTCTALHRHYLGEAIDLDSITEGLPARVVEELKELTGIIIKEERNARENEIKPASEEGEENVPPQEDGAEKNGVAREHFSRPEIILDTGRGDFKIAIGGHRFHIYDNTSPPEIYVSIVSGEMPPAWKKEIRLRGYLENGMVEIPKDYLNLPHISNEYLVTQYIGNIARPWRVKAWDGVPYMIFNEKGKKIEPVRLTKQRAWLFFPESYELFPENAVVSGSDVYFDEDKYRLTLVNFMFEPVIYLLGKDGSIYEIVPATSGPEPFLSSEEIAVGAWAEGKRPIYTGKVPCLCVPLKNEEEIKEWTIRIKKTFDDGTTKELINEQEILHLGSFSKGEYFEIDLNSEELLGPHPVGEYSIVLRRRDNSESSFELVVFPDLMLFFEPELYFPQKAEGCEAKFTMVIPENLKDVLQVKMKEPARIVEMDGDEVRIAVELEHNEFQVELIYSFEDRQCKTRVTVEIPKLRWRIREAKADEIKKWSQYVKEVWHEDCCGQVNSKLEVMLPGHLNNFGNRLRVYLKETGHQLVAKARGGFLQFDLSGLADTLRSLRNRWETFSLWLALEDPRGKSKADGKLFDIRCRWKIEDFRYTVKESSGDLILKVAWTDRGEQRDRVSRLWRLWEPWVEPLVLAIPDGVSELEIRRNADDFLPGPYLIKFDVDDPWSEELSNEFPIEKSNNEQIFIKSAGIHISVSECYWANKRKLRISGKLANSAGKREVSLKLYGVVKGDYKVWPAVTSTDESGYFSFDFEVENLKETIRPHWLGVIAGGSEPVYHFQVLPEPGGLWWPLTPALEGAFLDLDSDEGGQIYIDCTEERLDEPLLSREDSRRVLREIQQGNKKIPLDIRIGGGNKKAHLWKEENTSEIKIELETKAVKCTSCGKIEPDQQAWDTKHYPKCKSFIFNFREIRASLYWYQDLTLRIRNGQEKYQLAGNHLLTLYNNLARPLPDPVRQSLNKRSCGFDLEKIIMTLWEREKVCLAGWEGNKV